ncbi:unnamed protein product [Heterobilharzia americana]|nr:unnamed protein product [Heterobilharzia americana]
MKKPTCWTGESVELCSHELITYIDPLKYQEGVKYTSSYVAFMKEFCNLSSDIRINSSFSDIIETKQECSFNNSIQYYDLFIQCSRNGTLKQFYDRQLNCQWIKRQHKTPVVFHQIKPQIFNYPVKIKKFKLTNTLISNFYSRRNCPLGYYRELLINTTECIQCPPDHFADEYTSSYSCDPCPVHRPITRGITGAISMHCTGKIISNKRRNHRLRKHIPFEQEFATKVKRNIQQISVKITSSQENVRDRLMKWLGPDSNRIKLQDEAINVFKQLNCLGFSSKELFLMIISSTGIAWFGICLTFILFLSVQEPFHYYKRGRKNAKYRTKFDKAYDSLVWISSFFLQSILRFPLHLFHGLHRRTSEVSRKLSQSAFLIRLSMVRRETLNVFRQQLIHEELFEMRQAIILQDILTELTIARIIEAYENEQTKDYKKHLSQMTSSSMSKQLGSIDDNFENSINSKRIQREVEVLKPYFHIPRHYSTAFFLLHPKFWRQVSKPCSKFNAPFYPLEIKDGEI